ncbi:hypothetical protein GCM10022198_01920 [Klugiella xanthotipulae]|uniref:Pectate lyase-like protein n=1 Tax=Klugiella xanthotipulae TaxID=244735 RepID=A0A543I545_9MICO|nr:glycosyl hydrolase family 28-related protein [Klugiella xanthotipulae]TQM65671.1 pectate lyase-like protein [Klugiella xanthotipulae]
MTQNLATNPQFDTVNAAGHPLGVAAEAHSVGNSSVSVPLVSSRTVVEGGKTVRFDFTSAHPDGTAARLELTDAPTVTGHEYTLIVLARGGTTRSDQEPAVNITPVLTGNAPARPSRPASTWHEYRLSQAAGSDQGTGLLASGAQPGDWIEVRSVCLVPEGNYTGPHFDGDMNTGVWDGIPHNSTSTLAGTALPVHSVTSYGARGDGVTDDTAAIQRALDVPTGETRTVHFPHGTYRITQQLTWDPYRAHLLGENATVYCDLTLPGDQPLDTFERFDSRTYAVRVLSTAPFFFGNPPISNRTVVHSGIEFLAPERDQNRTKACNGLFIAGQVDDNLHTNWGDLTYADGRRKNSNFTLSNMTFRGFGVAACIGSFTYMMGFRDCAFMFNRTAVYLPRDRSRDVPVAGERFDDRGERIYFDTCDFASMTYGNYTIDMEADQTFKFINCSFDWTAQLLRAGDMSLIDFTGCHFETPTAEFNRSAHYGYPVSATASQPQPYPYMKLEAKSLVSISQSFFLLNNRAEKAHYPINYLAEGDAWATLNIVESFMLFTEVTAISGGGMRVNISDPKFHVDNEHIPMLGLTPKHNKLHSGIYTPGAWEFSNGNMYGNTIDNVENQTGVDGMLCLYSVAGPHNLATLSVTAPLNGAKAVAGLCVDLCFGDLPTQRQPNTNITATGICAEYLDSSGTVLGRYSFNTAYVQFTPVTLKHHEWSRVSLVHYNDSTIWDHGVALNNVELAERVRFVITLRGGAAGNWLLMSNAHINTYG